MERKLSGSADTSLLCITNTQRCGLMKGCQPMVGSWGGGYSCCDPEELYMRRTEENISWGKVA